MLKSSWKRVLFWINEQPLWLFLTDRSISTDQLLSSGWLSHPIQHFEACYCCRVQQGASCMAQLCCKGSRSVLGAHCELRVGELPNPELSYGLAVLNLLQVLSVSDRAAPA